ncbi:MAG: triose-phosphate isomerase [Planctomycetes bacterium]|nr:triose-phosphate isomerase [Planctomycetota bacterium]
MRRPFVAGNWKMNTIGESARALARAIAAHGSEEGVDVLVAPPFPYLAAVSACLSSSGVLLAAQNMSQEPCGAFTGEIAVEMLRDVGCDYVILGHSERRHIMGETDDLISRKVRAALAAGLKVIFCVGEQLSEREAGQMEAVLDRQIQRGLETVDDSAIGNLVIAYEPVWAIGTGVTASPEQAESAHSHLRNRLSERYNSQVAEQTRLLYGGSVKPDNAFELLSQPNVDGALVGGASLNAEAFLAIIDAAARVVDNG